MTITDTAHRPSHVPDDLVVDYDVFGTMSIPEALELAAGWRASGREVLWTDRNGGHWIVIKAADIRSGLTDPTEFDSHSRGVKLTYVSGRESMVPIELDGQEHADFRRVLNPLFAPARVRLLEADVRRIANELLDPIVASGRCEVVSEFARPLASSLFLSLVDWPLDDRQQLEEWVEHELNGIPGQTEEQNRATQMAAVAEITTYCQAQLARRREAPGEDMTSVLMAADVGGAPIQELRLVNMLLLLMVAGLDTTQSVYSQSTRVLASDPEKQALVRSHPDQTVAIVEELLRIVGPAGPNRSALRDTTLGGVEVRAGDRVHFMVQAGNRDPAEFVDPDQVVFDRDVNRHMTFGLGPHKCIGASLARVVLAAALQEFHRRVPQYRLVDSSSHLGGVWGMNSVIVEFDVPSGD